MEFLRSNLIAGLSLLLAFAVYAGSGFRFTPLVIVLFVIGGVWTAAVAIDGLRSRRKPALAAHLAKELKAGFELRDKASRAGNRSELHDATSAFVLWGLRVDELLHEAAPHYALDLPDREPWALEGRDKVLAKIDERLRAHASLVKQLERRGV